MARIEASGELSYGKFEVVVSGNGQVENIECSELIKKYVTDSINNAIGTIANNYAPEGGTMLQAYAFLVDLFGADNVTVDGDIGEMPYEPGVIY